MTDNPGMSIDNDNDHVNDDENKVDRNDEPRYIRYTSKLAELLIIYHQNDTDLQRTGMLVA